MNDTHQVSVSVNDINLTGDDMRPIKINEGVLLNASKYIGVSVNRRKNWKYDLVRLRRQMCVSLQVVSFLEKNKTFKYLDSLI
jgi:hypothetical protein